MHLHILILHFCEFAGPLSHEKADLVLAHIYEINLFSRSHAKLTIPVADLKKKKKSLFESLCFVLLDACLRLAGVSGS